jgi:hypothetical protein
VATQLKRLDTAIDAKERERARLLDAYQAELLGTRRAHPSHRRTRSPARRAHAREGDTGPAQRRAGRPEPHAPPTRWIQRPCRRLTARPRLRAAGSWCASWSRRSV